MTSFSSSIVSALLQSFTKNALEELFVSLAPMAESGTLRVLRVVPGPHVLDIHKLQYTKDLHTMMGYLMYHVDSFPLEELAIPLPCRLAQEGQVGFPALMWCLLHGCLRR